MERNLRRQQQYAWVACFAIMLNLLAPSISHALAASQGQALLVEVCGASGVKWMAVGAPAGPGSDAGPVSADADPLHLKHCQFCLNHAGAYAMPATHAIHFMAAARPPAPAPHYPAPSPRLPWSLASARAPPAA